MPYPRNATETPDDDQVTQKRTVQSNNREAAQIVALLGRYVHSSVLSAIGWKNSIKDLRWKFSKMDTSDATTKSFDIYKSCRLSK